MTLVAILGLVVSVAGADLSSDPASRGYALERQKDGYIHRAGQFEARIEPDGQVHFQDHRVNLERLQIGPVVLERGAASGRWSVDSLLGGVKDEALHERSPTGPSSNPASGPRG